MGESKLSTPKEFIVPTLPVVSIVGRPNVGKSSLFNRVIGKPIAVVDDIAGVTRDRNYMPASWNGIDFTVVDTGGLIPTSRESIATSIAQQVDIAIAESRAIVFLCDATTGPTDLDVMIASKLRKAVRDKLILAVNKAEKPSARLEADQFISLGCGDPFAVSAIHGTGVGDLLDEVCKRLQQSFKDNPPAPKGEELAVAVIGRPNMGKSSFVNSLLNQQRMIVDCVPGTTRDAIDSTFSHNGQNIRIIDTAGLRRKAQVKEELEYFTNVHALNSIQRCDICVLMCDAADGVKEQDLKIVNQIFQQRKGLVVCLNKWDLVEKDHKTFDHFVKDLKQRFMELRHVPITSISALTGQRVRGVIDLAQKVKARLGSRIPTAEFKNALTEWTLKHPHPFNAGKLVRVMGGKQRKGTYPQFEFYCSNHQLIMPAYERYLANKIYELGDFEGCPLGLSFKPAALPHRRQRQFHQADHDTASHDRRESADD
jgi:GTP-binding protein